MEGSSGWPNKFKKWKNQLFPPKTIEPQPIDSKSTLYEPINPNVLLALQKEQNKMHYSLREKLIELHRSPPANEQSLQILQAEIAALMNHLDTTDRRLYTDHVNYNLTQNRFPPITPDTLFNTDNLANINRYMNWRRDKLNPKNKDNMDMNPRQCTTT